MSATAAGSAAAAVAARCRATPVLTSVGGTAAAAAGMPGMEGVDEEELKKVMAELEKQMGSDPAAAVDQMMQGLLAKEVLHPSLIDIAGKYPEWLEKNSSKLAAAEHKKYTQQYEAIQDICRVYEDESLDGGEQVKRVMVLMEKMQGYGAPPEEICKGLGMELGPDGMPGFPGMAGMPGAPGQCAVM